MKISTGIPIFNTPIDPQGTENQPPNAIFHTGSKNLMSHIIDVSETAIIVKAYGFVNDASTITVCTVTTERDGLNYAAPMVLNGRHVQLSTRNNILVIDMTGKYTFQLSDGLGVTTCAYHESGLGLWSFGLNAYAQANGMLEFIETETVRPVVSENQVREYVKLSSYGAGTNQQNLLQIRSDGLYYGIAPPIQFINQYVSSSTGSDSDIYDPINPGTNDGTPAKPWKTIQHALSHLPDGTQGNIYLYAGDTFPTYGPSYTTPPSSIPDVINGHTTNDAFTHVLVIGNRQVTIVPYNDPAITYIQNYNAAHGSGFNPYLCAQINFPTIKISVFLPTDSSGYLPAAFDIGVNGLLIVAGITIVVGTTGTVSPSYYWGAFFGGGSVTLTGGNVTLSNIPLVGASSSSGTESFSMNSVVFSDHPTPTAPNPLFCQVGAQMFINTQGTSPGGGVIIPGVPAYTYNADNAESFLVNKLWWPDIIIYSTPSRSFRKVISSIAIA
jgi:hypothetical protein